jgi:hypothetical protein
MGTVILLGRLVMVEQLTLWFEHETFPKTGIHPGSSPGQAFSGGML